MLRSLPKSGAKLGLSVAKRSSIIHELYWPLAYCLVPIILALVFPLGMSEQSKLMTVPARALLLLLSGWIIVQGWRGKIGPTLGGIPLLCIAVFWVLYLLRIVHDYYLSSTVTLLQVGSVEYLARAFGMGLVPALAFAYLPRLVNGRRILIWMFGFSLIFNLLILYVYRDVSAESYRNLVNRGFDRMELISPLTIAYGGCQLITLSLFLIRFRDASSYGWNFLSGLGICIGAYALVRGESRGAMVAAIVVMLFAIFSCNFKTVTQRILLGGTLLSLFLGFVAFKGLSSESALRARIEYTFDEAARRDGSLGSGRSGMWANALSQFSENPLTGSGLVEYYSGTYPHNHIIEALMATGLIGGGAFLCLTLYAVYQAFKIIHRSEEFGWVGALYITYLVGSMFSSGIIQPEMWYSTFSVLGVAPIQVMNRTGSSKRAFQRNNHSSGR